MLSHITIWNNANKIDYSKNLYKVRDILPLCLTCHMIIRILSFGGDGIGKLFTVT